MIVNSINNEECNTYPFISTTFEQLNLENYHPLLQYNEPSIATKSNNDHALSNLVADTKRSSNASTLTGDVVPLPCKYSDSNNKGCAPCSIDADNEEPTTILTAGKTLVHKTVSFSEAPSITKQINQKNDTLSLKRSSFTTTISQSQSSSLYTIPSLEEILDLMFPPSIYTDVNNQKQFKVVSRHPASRADVLQLEKKLDEFLLRCRARLKPLCRIREALFAEAFDEILRQITIECPERGLILARLRDELSVNIATQRAICLEAVHVSERHAGIHSDIKKLENTISELMQKKHKLLEENVTISQRLKLLEEQSLREQEERTKSQTAEIAFLEKKHCMFEIVLKTLRKEESSFNVSINQLEQHQTTTSS